MIKREDRLWKSVIWALPVEFISYAHPEAHKILDLNRQPEFLDKELEQVYSPDHEQFSTVVADHLIKVYTLKGNGDYILLHIEVQQKYSINVGERMFTYAYRVYDKFRKPITAWLILTESTQKIRPDFFELDFMGTQIKYKFNALKISDARDDKLLADSNPFALVIMTAKIWVAGRLIKETLKRDQYLFPRKIKLIELLLSRNLEAVKHNELLNFINYTIRLENKEIRTKFDNELLKLTTESVMMTVTETILSFYKEDGVLEEKYRVVKEMKKLNMPLSLISKVTKLSIRQIKKASDLSKKN
ncbi:hypothetical protein ACSBL2_01395 [Pedobacter sp. AW31-3R]|uniref:hypothetical protein n=1 Tax=Pedobacter sp. AW31-3R TaxID=3445781 RepID=UPI003FA06C89